MAACVTWSTARSGWYASHYASGRVSYGSVRTWSIQSIFCSHSIKGAGEAGAIPVGALFAQAIEGALDLKRRGVELLEIPLSPSRLFELTRNAPR